MTAVAMGKMRACRDVGMTTGKMQGTTHSLPTCSVIAIGHGRMMSATCLVS